MNKFLMFFLLFCLYPLTGYPVSRIILTDNQQGYPIKFDILEDKTAALTIADVVKPELGLQFSPIKTRSVNYGFTNNAYWVRFEISNQARQPNEWFLRLQFPNMQHIDFCTPDNKTLKYSCKKTGTYYAFSSRDLPYPHFIFKLPVTAGQNKIFYLRFQNHASMQIALKVNSLPELINSTWEQKFAWGAFLGYLLLGSFYNLFFWLYFRERSYLYYLGINFSITMYQFSFDGLTAKYFWPDAPIFNHFAAPFFMILFLLFSIKFTCAFLKSRQHTPLLDRLAQIEGLGLLAMILILLATDYGIATVWLSLIALLTELTLFGMSLTRWYYQNFRSARYLVVGWSLLFLQTTLIAITRMGSLTIEGFTEHFQIPTLVTFSIFTLFNTFLSLALVDKVYLLKEQRQKALEQNAELTHAQNQFMSEQNSLLEQEVAKRTQALADTNNDLEIARQKAEAALQAKSDFLANMSHEIRTPMNAVIGLSHLILKTELNGQQQDFVKKIQGSTQHLMAIINDILDFSKIESSKFEIEQREFELGKLLKNLTALMLEKAAAKSLKLVVELDPAISDYLIGDSMRLTRILVNYVDNAVKFSEGGQIVIAAQLKAQSDKDVLIYFAVHDTGIGLTEAQQVLLFQRFQQVDTSSSRKYGGTGMGLAISKSLAELMGGEVGVISEVGKGSTFWFTARVTKSQKQKSVRLNSDSDSAPAVPEKLQAIAGARVLLVEDDALNQEVVVKLLEEVQLSVDVAENGAVAVQKIQRQVYDIVLMAIQIPVLDGIAVTRIIRELPESARLPIVGLTANVMPSERERCLETGMNDYLGKPVKPEQLWDSLLEWLQPKLASDTELTAMAAEQINSNQLGKLLRQLSELLEESDSEVVDVLQVNEDFLQQAFAEHYPPFHDAIQSFDFDTAAVILKQVAKSRQMSLD